MVSRHRTSKTPDVEVNWSEEKLREAYDANRDYYRKSVGEFAPLTAEVWKKLR
jgi:hypothetical protein